MKPFDSTPRRGDWREEEIRRATDALQRAGAVASVALDLTGVVVLAGRLINAALPRLKKRNEARWDDLPVVRCSSYAAPWRFAEEVLQHAMPARVPQLRPPMGRSGRRRRRAERRCSQECRYRSVHASLTGLLPRASGE